MTQKSERTVDRLGMSIDEKMKETITAMNLLDIHTAACCEGHDERTSVHAPWIDIEGVEVKALSEEQRALLVDKDGNKDRIEAIAEKAEHLNLEEQKKLLTLLDEFYQERSVPFRQMLTIQGRKWRSRLQSQGADVQQIEAEETMRRRLQEYQEEILAFTQFLKKKFFET